MPLVDLKLFEINDINCASEFTTPIYYMFTYRYLWYSSGTMIVIVIVKGKKEYIYIYVCVLQLAYGDLKRCECPLVDAWIGIRDNDETSI